MDFSFNTLTLTENRLANRIGMINSTFFTSANLKDQIDKKIRNHLNHIFGDGFKTNAKGIHGFRNFLWTVLQNSSSSSYDFEESMFPSYQNEWVLYPIKPIIDIIKNESFGQERSTLRRYLRHYSPTCLDIITQNEGMYLPCLFYLGIPPKFRRIAFDFCDALTTQYITDEESAAITAAMKVLNDNSIKWFNLHPTLMDNQRKVSRFIYD